MAEQKKLFGKVQIVWSRSTTLLKALVILLIVFSMVALVALNWVRASIQKQTEAVRAEAAAVEDRNEVLKERMEDISSIDSVQEIAKEELGLVSPNTILIKPQ